MIQDYAHPSDGTFNPPISPNSMTLYMYSCTDLYDCPVQDDGLSNTCTCSNHHSSTHIHIGTQLGVRGEREGREEG